MVVLSNAHQYLNTKNIKNKINGLINSYEICVGPKVFKIGEFPAGETASDLLLMSSRIHKI